MKSFKVVFAALVFFGLNFAFAQGVEPIKTDSILNLKIVQLATVGQDFADGAASSASVSLKIDQMTGDRIYTTAKNGLVLRKNKSFGTVQRNRYVFAGDEVGDVLPANFAVGEKWKEVAYYKSNRCGRVKHEFDASITQGPDVAVNIKGAPVTLKTLQIVREGTWYAPNCGGSGKKHLKVLFSPELNEIVHDEFRVYYRGIAYAGEKMILESIN